jgi:hypothetical protein
MNALGRKSAFLAILLVFATALAGSAYTLWFEDLQLNVQANTTSLDGRIRCGIVGDNENLNWPSPPDNHPVFDQPHSSYPEGPLLGPGGTLKDVATGPVSDRPDGDPHQWSVTIGNAYPGYAYDCEVEILNTAPLPWHVEDIQIVVEECPVPTGPCTTLVPPPNSQVTNCPLVALSDCTWGDLGINPPSGHPGGLANWSPIYAEVANWEGCQVHQGIDLEASLFIGINQPAKENTKYVITLTYTVNQWNESVWNGCTQPKPTPGSGPV